MHDSREVRGAAGIIAMLCHRYYLATFSRLIINFNEIQSILIGDSLNLQYSFSTVTR